MTHSLTRTVTYATVVAMLLALLAVGPVSAGTYKRDVAAERYAHKLLNCTRTGGWVNEQGQCLAYGSGKFSAKRPALRLHRNISLKVAWPWARTMAVKNVCAHAIPGKPQLARRMRSKGFKYRTYGENLGCMWGSNDAKAAVLMVHRMMQAEKGSAGGHWKNMKNRAYKSVGIGVARGNGRVTVVWDFYGKRY